MADLTIPDGFTAAGTATIPDGFQPQPPQQGMLWPVSIDAQGNRHLDWSAGLTGMLGSAISAPYDAYMGKLGASPDDPAMTDRAMGVASMFSPASAAARAGEIVPGALLKSVVPSAQQLKSAADAGYAAARNSGLDISGDAVGDMARGAQQSLTADRGIIAKTAPKTFGLLDELANPPAGGFVGVPGLLAAKSGLSGLSLEPGTEGLAARDALGRLRSFMSSVTDDQLAQTTTGTAPAAPAADIAQTIRNADGNYAAAQRSNSLTGTLDNANTGILERAEARADASNSGRNLDNSLRGRVASFLQNPSNVAGFSQPEIGALKGVVAGGPIQNSARFVGNLLGGGGGLGELAGMGLGAALGSHMGGEVGAGLGAAIPATVGTAAKTLENSLARNSLNNADKIVRMNSPLYRQMEMQGFLAAPAMGPNNLVTRTLLPGLLSPPASPVPSNPLPPGWA